LREEESKWIDVSMKFGGDAGRFERKFVLFTDDTAQPVILASFVGRVTE
jgi:hypothetical protein